MGAALPRIAGTESTASSRDRFFATYPGAEAAGVKPAGVGTVDVATEVVVVLVTVVPVVTIVVVMALRTY